MKKEAAEKVEITINMENNDPFNGPLTEEELKNALHKCKRTSPAPDYIQYEFLKRMGTKKRSKLQYPKIWSKGVFPKK
jgi:hypothetical protein